MTVVHTILTVIQVIFALLLVLVVSAQSGKSSGLGAISGNSETFMSKNQGASTDAKLAKATKWVAVVFVVLTLVLNLPIWG